MIDTGAELSTDGKIAFSAITGIGFPDTWHLDRWVAPDGLDEWVAPDGSQHLMGRTSTSTLAPQRDEHLDECRPAVP